MVSVSAGGRNGTSSGIGIVCSRAEYQAESRSGKLLALTKTRGGQIHGHVSVEKRLRAADGRCIQFIDCRLEAPVIQFFEGRDLLRASLSLCRSQFPDQLSPCFNFCSLLRSFKHHNNGEREGKDAAASAADADQIPQSHSLATHHPLPLTLCDLISSQQTDSHQQRFSTSSLFTPRHVESAIVHVSQPRSFEVREGKGRGWPIVRRRLCPGSLRGSLSLSNCDPDLDLLHRDR